ncbi:hypothetical protein BDV37DRAFT_51498 [Aspergillus pseudonomiae]|uniref:Uncharacterized protein n=1 Tax=Aspergillus pseudonomiae TaxID=1506151 RepID=A0A5N7DMB4_9EURO|nr:uncharacterized protein BDV37DRAFT_51498 [Aspergillus pseudonomiae]KAE8406618.1 hypothetical protein BDV37DRAFT_51498 [Aspergillus pseudonomiae]
MDRHCYHYCADDTLGSFRNHTITNGLAPLVWTRCPIVGSCRASASENSHCLKTHLKWSIISHIAGRKNEMTEKNEEKIYQSIGYPLRETNQRPPLFAPLPSGEDHAPRKFVTSGSPICFALWLLRFL